MPANPDLKGFYEGFFGTGTLEELVDEEPVQESPADKSAAEREAADFDNKWARERLARATQDRGERKTYAKRIFWLVVVWLATIIFLLIFQGFLGPWELFKLSDSVLIAVATTTTASVTALLVVVARSLFPQSSIPKERPSRSGSGEGHSKRRA